MKSGQSFTASNNMSVPISSATALDVLRLQVGKTICQLCSISQKLVRSLGIMFEAYELAPLSTRLRIKLHERNGTYRDHHAWPVRLYRYVPSQLGARDQRRFIAVGRWAGRHQASHHAFNNTHLNVLLACDCGNPDTVFFRNLVADLVTGSGSSCSKPS